MMFATIRYRTILKTPLVGMSAVSSLLRHQPLPRMAIFPPRPRILRFSTTSRNNDTDEDITKEQATLSRSPEQLKRRQDWIQTRANWKAGSSSVSDIEWADRIEKEVDLAEAQGQAMGKEEADKFGRNALTGAIVLNLAAVILLVWVYQVTQKLKGLKRRLEEKGGQILQRERDMGEKQRQMEEKEEQIQESGKNLNSRGPLAWIAAVEG